MATLPVFSFSWVCQLGVGDSSGWLEILDVRILSMKSFPDPEKALQAAGLWE